MSSNLTISKYDREENIVNQASHSFSPSAVISFELEKQYPTLQINLNNNIAVSPSYRNVQLFATVPQANEATKQVFNNSFKGKSEDLSARKIPFEHLSGETLAVSYAAFPTNHNIY